jgi:hypothetical protein
LRELITTMDHGHRRLKLAALEAEFGDGGAGAAE